MNIHAISFSPIRLFVLRIAVCSLDATRNLHLHRASFISDKCDNHRNGNGDGNGDGDGGSDSDGAAVRAQQLCNLHRAV